MSSETTSDFDKALLALYRKLNLSSLSKIDDQLQTICISTSEILNVDRTSIWLYNEDKTAISCACLYIKAKDQCEKGIVLERKNFEPYFKAMESELKIEASRATEHKATSCFTDSYLTPLGICSMMDTPIWRADSVIGVLCMEYTTPKASWSHDEKTVSRNIADLSAKVFERFSILELVETLEQKVERRTKALKQTLDDLKSTQERMVVQEKLASLGTLTAGIAHEIKNPLGLITNASEALPHLIDSIGHLCVSDEDQSHLEQIHELIRIISTHSARTNTIINNMLSQVSESEDKTEDYDLSESCQQSIDLARRSLWAKYAHDIDFIVNLEQRVYVSHCKQDITKIFNNLLQNSAHSIAEKASQLNYYKPKIEIHLKKMDLVAELEIHDNGMGIPENILHKVLNPFFTTKNPEEGTGLGLSMVSDLVKSHSGFLHIDSKKNDFTKIKIQLPVIET